MTNLIDDPTLGTVRDELEDMLVAHMKKIGDEFLSRDEYYTRFGIELDHRGKVVDLVENMYDRVG